ncbi:MAG: hypothetical protein ACRDY1_10540 [Acidimicrobiales bacterium]
MRPSPTAVVPVAPRQLTVAIRLDVARVAAGQRLDGTLVVDNPGPAFNLTALERSKAPPCRPAFAIAVSRGRFHNTVGFTARCTIGPFTIGHGTSRHRFTVLTSYAQCLAPAGSSLVSIPECLPGGPALPLPAGTYRGVIVWSEPVPLPTPHSVSVVLSPARTG